MLGKSGWLAGALAACLLAWSPGTALADDGHRGHGARNDRHNGHFERHNRSYDHGYRRPPRYWSRHGHAHGYGHSHRHGGVTIVIRPQRQARVPERAPDDRAIIWKDPPSLAQTPVAPSGVYQTEDGRYCREYLGTASVGGQTREVYGLACRQADGAWEIVQ